MGAGKEKEPVKAAPITAKKVLPAVGLHTIAKPRKNGSDIYGR